MGGPKKPKRPDAVGQWSSKQWQAEIDALRPILHGCGLDEVIKWRKLCYAHEGKNIAIIQEMKAHLALMFFKGALLKDSAGVLKKPGENSHAARRFEFTAASDIVGSKALIGRYVREAIALEKAGAEVAKPPGTLVLAEELVARLERDPALEAAFEALTPGRRRGYNLYFSAPKGTEARARRIEKYAPKILAGKGIHDR